MTELVNIKKDEINGNAILVHGKGEKDRTCYLNAKAVVALESYLKERKDGNPYLFPGGLVKMVREASHPDELSKWYTDEKFVHKTKQVDIASIEALVRNLGERTGVKKVYPHKFRRTCATFALRRGMAIEQVSKMLGHEQISTTQIYLDLNERELEAAHRKYVV